MSRPELQAPPEIFYNEEEAAKYTFNSHILAIQTQLAERCLDLLMLDDNNSSLLLDIGCGSGLSGAAISSRGCHWIGLDISSPMLAVAKKKNLIENDVFLADMGQPLRWRPGSFDGAISVSALQWLCNADKGDHDPYKRLANFFRWLYSALVPGGRAALQFYPKDERQTEIITKAALKCGFGGGVVTDFPNSTRAKKHYLLLWAGGDHAQHILPEALEVEEDQIKVGQRKALPRPNQKRKNVKDRDWVRNKKEQMRRKGKDVKSDSKFTGRKRKDRL